MADPAAENQAHTEVAHGEGEEHVVATWNGLSPDFFVALAMVVVFAIMLKAKVPAMIAATLDKKIAGIREQLDTAANLRKEAEALKAEYEKKARDAEQDIAAMKTNAENQADAIVAKAKDDATALIARRQAVSEAKISSAERAAIAEIREHAASAASAAAANLLAERVDQKADAKLVDEAISGI